MDIKKIMRDIKMYAVFLAAALLFYFVIIPRQIYMSAAAKAEAFSPDTFPNAISVLFIVVSAAGLIYSVVQYVNAVKKFGKPEKEHTKLTRKRVMELAIPFIVLALILIYVVLFKGIGFIPATIIVPPFILIVIGDRKWYHYLIFYAFAAVMYLLFKFVLLVPIH